MATLPKAVTELISSLERLPGVGPKSATRMAFYLLTVPEGYAKQLSENIQRIKSEVVICKKCFSVSDKEVCDICGDSNRRQNLICVVERAIDVMALENVGGFKGVYHVLGGVINPLDHVGPEDLKIEELINRIKGACGNNECEIILAMNPTMEGEATALYIKKQIDSLGNDKIKITRIGSGLPMGADLEFTDQATLQRAMEGRREV